MKRLFFILFFTLFSFAVHATHVMGGEITWKCNGNGTVFELVFYRDCNGAEVNTISENIRVWNHPTINSIQVLFQSRTDISPSCSPVAGSPLPLECGSGANGGNGVGAVEKVIYRSAPIVLTGIPPAGSGWVFTYENFSRSNIITNISNPSSFGVTIAAKMYANPNSIADVCTDNSPDFLQDPYLVHCSSEEYSYNLHPVDVDLDSVAVLFGTPFNNFPSGGYNPPTNPAPVPFEPGFSATSPTPDASMQPGNIPAALNPVTGHLSFTSNTTGSFVIKVVAQSFRNGQLIAEIEREMQVIILNCAGANTAPMIPGPFAGLFETTVDAGTLVNFNLQAVDPELLQDGSVQQNYLTTTSLQYGTNFTATSGCANAPCATLNSTPVIIGNQGVSTQFSWQTDCNHLQDVNGNVSLLVPYNFVFKVQDNYCQIPKTTYKTVTIYVRNPGVIPATTINCISTELNGDVTVDWNPVSDPDGSFVQFELHSVQNGLMGTFPIGTTSATVPNPGNNLDFFVNVVSGCNGNTVLSSDTVSNVFLTLFNPANGTAQLSWNTPAPNPLPGMNPFCDVQREYPLGTWTTIATLPYTTTNFTDTIDICSANLNYQVVYTTPTCNFNSNIVGDAFEDMINPTIPVISNVSVDTISGNMVINWNMNDQPDTYGYVIYYQDANGFIVEIDTLYGINSTSYTDLAPITGAVTYTVAAFDSCFTGSTPPTYQTSAKGELHTSMFLTYNLNPCNGNVVFDWNAYVGWGNELSGYDIFARKDSGAWQILGSTNDLSEAFDLASLSSYCVTIRANKTDGTVSFSNIVCLTVTTPPPPAEHYLQVATVEGNTVVLRHHISIGNNVSSIRFEKLNPLNGQFELLGEVPATATTLSFVDAAVSVNSETYTYRAVVVDSCGGLGIVSNKATTVLLTATSDQTLYKNYIQWTPYSVFDGGVLQYELYRGIDGIFNPTPIAILDPDERYFEDDVDDFGNNTGKFCYYVIAKESENQYNIEELSYSNQACTVIDPLVYIPNAFTPEGANPIFIPIVTFSDVNKYEFSVVDRWGQLIFQTHDITKGWNGNHQSNDKLVPLGVYVYVVKVVDGNNQEYFYRGTVTVVR